MMKTLAALIFAFTLNVIVSGQTPPSKYVLTSKQNDTTSEQLIFKGRLAEVYVEKTIFHSRTENNFLMKFIIKNISDKTIGLDLADYWKVIYPNQWGFYKKPYREVVDEEQIIPDKAIDTKGILKKFKEKTLTMIKPNETVEYYRDWNGSGEKVELKNKEDYLIISVDGQLLLTNGKAFEHVTMNNAEENKRVVVLSFPINYKVIPEKAMIIKK